MSVHKTPEEKANFDRKLEKLIFDSYGQDNNYHSIRHGLRQCLVALGDYVPGWSGVGVERQFAIAQATYVVASCSVGHTAQKLRLGAADPDCADFVYALEYGYQDPKTIELNKPTQRLLGK